MCFGLRIGNHLTTLIEKAEDTTRTFTNATRQANPSNSLYDANYLYSQEWSERTFTNIRRSLSNVGDAYDNGGYSFEDAEVAGMQYLGYMGRFLILNVLGGSKSTRGYANMRRLEENLRFLKHRVAIHRRSRRSDSPPILLSSIRTVGDQIDQIKEFLARVKEMDPIVLNLVSGSPAAIDAHIEFMNLAINIEHTLANYENEFNQINREFNDPNNEYRGF